MRGFGILLLAAAVSAAPQGLREDGIREEDARILADDTYKNEDGSYSISFRTEKGITQKETGISFPGALPESGTYVKEGVVEYQLADGSPVRLLYVADENGFEILNPEALDQVLPTPPPTEYPLPKVPGAGMEVPEPLPEFNVGLAKKGATVAPLWQ